MKRNTEEEKVKLNGVHERMDRMNGHSEKNRERFEQRLAKFKVRVLPPPGGRPHPADAWRVETKALPSVRRPHLHGAVKDGHTPSTVTDTTLTSYTPKKYGDTI